MNKQIIQDFIVKAIAEDQGDGDHTSIATIPENAQGQAKLLVKEPGVLAGVELAMAIFDYVDPSLKIQTLLFDGEDIKSGDIPFEVSGNARSILLAERLVLNCMQRMSGIATQTKKIVAKLKPYKTKLLDTRKTTPNLRYLEKWAVRIGGGVNHRVGLYDMILIKDNHIDYAGGIGKAISAANNYLKVQNKDLEIEIEVRNLAELDEVLKHGNITRIMLDNFSYADLRRAIALVGSRYQTEASGGITIDNAVEFAKCGVDYVSIGAITHSVKGLDMSLKAF